MSLVLKDILPTIKRLDLLLAGNIYVLEKDQSIKALSTFTKLKLWGSYPIRIAMFYLGLSITFDSKNRPVSVLTLAHQGFLAESWTR